MTESCLNTKSEEKQKGENDQCKPTETVTSCE